MPVGVGHGASVYTLRMGTGIPSGLLAGLSGRLLEAAEFAAAGATVAETARAMGLQPNTVRGYLKEVYRALGVSNRVELAHSVGTEPSRDGRTIAWTPFDVKALARSEPNGVRKGP